jgi:hypothetical protein
MCLLNKWVAKKWPTTKRGEGIDLVLGLEKFSKNENQNMQQH